MAVSGQITAPALSVLDAHVRNCDECRAFLQDFRPFKTHVAPVIAATHSRQLEPPEGMRERFLERAAQAGITTHVGPAAATPVVVRKAHPSRLRGRWESLSDGAGRWRVTPLQITAAAAACVALLWAGYVVGRRQLPTQHSPAAPVAAGRPAAKPSESPEVSALRAQVAELQAANERSEARVATLSRDMARALSEKARLMSSLARTTENAAASGQDFKAERERLVAVQNRLVDIQAALDEERKKSVTTEAILIAQEKATQEALNKSDELQGQLERERANKSAAGEFSHLIAARNLHIIDVYDNERGKESRRSFGRVFYVEGRSLVFYAYDLSPARRNTKFSFRVWGETAGVKSASYSLGTLQADDKSPDRWVLTCNDPNVLTRINAVYITAEAPGVLEASPQGRKLMYAFLGNPNHP